MDTDVFKYISTLTPISIDRLYEDAASCQAVFRSLPPVAQQYVLRLLYLDQPFAVKVLLPWVRQDAQSLLQQRQALHKMVGLRIILQAENSGTGPDATFKINPVFQHQLRHIIAQGPLKYLPVAKKDKNQPSIQDLDDYAKDSWETVLHYMVGSTSVPVPSDGIVDLLVQCNLIQHDAENRVNITPAGFQFLLKDTVSQMWKIILMYVETAESRNLVRNEILSFIFNLSYAQLGMSYSVKELTDSQRIFLMDLVEFGLVWQREESSSRYYPTHLSLMLSQGSVSVQEAEGFIIVETNFKLYAYTSSDLQVALLSSFLQLDYRLPGFVVGTITRESVQKALVLGITAKQIANFLVKHCHPLVLKQEAPVPENILDQLFLWERERNRVTFENACLYHEFPSQEVFDRTIHKAKELNVLLWSRADRRQLAVSAVGNDEIRKFVKHCLT
eukprot:GILI01030698.1.p1 GENE.GILI01030698.1~~GILI01030698.1.p1  ORF type:complete len:445 (-),score=89.02 GILI01030698.1:57-1391(-)